MADAPQAPSEEQLAQGKAAADAEIARWQGDFEEKDLEVKYKRDETDKDKETTEEDKDDVDTEEDATEDDDNTKKTEVVAEVPTVESVVAAEDPGDYVPADHSFEVTLADGKSHKVASREDAEKLAADPENFENPQQLMDFINKQNKMNQAFDKDYEKWEKDKQTFTEQLDIETKRRETIDAYTSEFSYLIGKGLLPAADAKYLDADWNDPEVAKQPGVKEQLELMNYMVKENKVRAKAGVKQLTSIVDTYNAMQAAADAKKEEGEQRKAAGAKVAGVSPSQQGPLVPKGIAVGNPNVLKRGASIWDD